MTSINIQNTIKKVLSCPSPRGWHTSILLTISKNPDIRSGQGIILFGGLRLKNNICPQPFLNGSMKTDRKAFEIEYLNDVCIYDIDNLSWHRFTPDSLVPWPTARYGMLYVCNTYLYVLL